MVPGTQEAEGAGTRAPPSDIDEGDRLPINSTIEQLTKVLAYAGGLLMLVAIALTLVSIVGRYVFSAPVPGDYELVETICAVGIFLFFPYTQATGSNITVKFFTTGLSRRHQRMFDLIHDVIFAVVAALLAWRLGIGLSHKFVSGESTMLVRMPYWWPYSFAVASMALLCIVCLARIVAAIGELRR
jgi:TRAP-type C4-dicarboxylate transport system permease small subunit